MNKLNLFITGPSGAGKSTAAKTIAARESLSYIDYDNAYKPAPILPPVGFDTVDPESCLAFLKSLEDDCVVDNVPYDPTWGTFNRWVADRKDVKVFCSVLPMDRWLNRKTGGGHELTPKIWNRFWIEVMPTMEAEVTYIWGQEELGHREAMSMIKMKGMILDRLASAKYDHVYQDIPEIGHLGYSGSEESWSRIEPLADWEGKTVVDCGCSHGFMLFRARDAGCEGAVGLDFLEDVLTTCRAVNMLRGDRVRFKTWMAGQPIPEADIALCMNALHHFPDDRHPLGTHCPVKCSTQKFFDTIRSPVTIFEAYKSHAEEIRANWDTVEAFPSARPGRSIYRCTR